MRISLRSINNKIDTFLEKSIRIKSPKLRTAIIVGLYVGACILLFGILPFVLGAYLVLLIAEKIEHKGLKYGFETAIILLTLVIGVPWAAAVYSPGDTRKPEVLGEQTAQPTAETSKTNTEVKEESKMEIISFETENQDDPTLAKGRTKVKQEGQDGEKQLKYKVTYVDGKETSRELISETVTKEPVKKIILAGTWVATPSPVINQPQPTDNSDDGCDPNYSGVCVPIASDVDCAGGSGNGPAYVRGPITVIGRDIYDLDRDGDGIGCEK